LPTPQPTFSINGNVLTADQTWPSYQWLMGGNNIPGATASSYTMTQTGIYSLMVTDSNGCSGVSDSSIAIGVAPLMGEWSDLTIYPNPAGSEFRLRTVTPIGDALVVTVQDMFGRQVLSQALPQLADEVAFDVRSLAAGSYMVLVHSVAGQRKVFRLVHL
jgi:hypothetical protein